MLEKDRWCDRSIRDARHSVESSGRLNAAWLFGTRAAKPILAAVMCGRIKRPDI